MLEVFENIHHANSMDGCQAVLILGEPGVGKPHSYVHKVETGERRIDPVEFIAWCRSCGLDPAGALRQVERRKA